MIVDLGARRCHIGAGPMTGTPLDAAEFRTVLIAHCAAENGGDSGLKQEHAHALSRVFAEMAS